MAIQDTVKETVQEEASRVADITKSAVSSRTYLYPLKGIAYFITHKELWKPLMERIIPSLTLSIGVLVGMFLLTYVPQAAVLTIFNGPVAIVNTVLLVLSESATLITILSKMFVIDEALIDVFDGVLLQKDLSDLVSKGRDLNLNKSGDTMKKLGKLVRKPFARFSPKEIIRYFIWMPLNFIPIIGTTIFLIVQGRKAGPAAHARWFQLRGFNDNQRNEWISRHKGAYVAFGTASLIFTLLPVVSIFFAFTNATGAALWAADIEQGKDVGSINPKAPQGTAPELRKRVEAIGDEKEL